MGETDVNVRVVSEAQSKGFKDAEQGINKVTNAANKAKPGLDKAGQATAAMGGKSKIAGARVGGLVQAMLRGLGITTGATEASIAAGEAQEAMGNKARLAGAMIGIAAVAVAVLLPLLIKLVNRSKEANAKLAELRTEMVGLSAQFKEAAETLPDATRELTQFADITEELALLQQQLKINELREQMQKLEKATERGVFTLRDNVTELSALTKAKVADIKETLKSTTTVESAAGKTAGLVKQIKLEVEFNKKAGAQRNANRKTMEAVGLQLKLLEDAAERGSILSDEIREKLVLERERRRELTEQLKKEKAAREDLNNILGAGAILDIEARNKARETKAEEEQSTQDSLDLATERILAIRRERDARIKAGKDIVDSRRRGGAQERAIVATNTSAAVGAMSALFGQNKSFLIAQAIADTFASANNALATVRPWPAAIAAAAISIATGFANVSSIQSQELGFDNPFSDRLADRLGVKFAEDMLGLIGGGFSRRVAQSAGANAGGPSNASTTNVDNSGMRIESLTLPGFVGAGRTEFLKGLNRELIKVQRLEARTRIGRTVQG
jgi:hypothetical protein